jgi:dTDP-4-dehydrorhamnose 3,5-epimerase
MRFTQTPLGSAFIVEIEHQQDERGFFARSFCRREFEQHGLAVEVVQSSISYNRRRHTLRGLHYQAAPHQEAKVVRCVAGAIYDVIVDLRRASPTYLRWYAVELSAATMNAIYVPPDFAHGFLSLTDDATVLYQMSTEHEPKAARGLRWNDPMLAITWPTAPQVIGERDASYTLLSEVDHG